MSEIRGGRRRLIALLILLAAGGLFPFGWLGREWPAFNAWLGFIFRSLAAHIAGHALIFFSLGLATLATVPDLGRRPRLYAALMLVAAFGQELLQKTHKGLIFHPDDLADILVDLIAAALAFATWAWWARRTPEREL